MSIRIAKIISSKEIIINAGFEQGIHEGDRFEIIDKISDSDVTDPETGEILGKLTSSKGEVIVTRVFKRMSIAESPFENIAQISAFNIQKDLNVDPNEITGNIPTHSNTPIRVGDPLSKIGN